MLIQLNLLILTEQEDFLELVDEQHYIHIDELIYDYHLQEKQ